MALQGVWLCVGVEKVREWSWRRRAERGILGPPEMLGGIWEYLARSVPRLQARGW